MRIIKLPVFGIVINLMGKGAGNITSLLHEEGPGGDYDPPDEYNAAIDGVESLILAHACAGIDVDSPAYIEGIETAVQAIGQNF